MLKALLSIPHHTLRDKFVLLRNILGIVFFSLLHPLSLAVAFIFVLSITQDMDNTRGYFLLPFFSVPAYLYLLNRNFYSHWTKTTNLPINRFFCAVFSSQIIYFLFYLLVYVLIFKIPPHLNPFFVGFMYPPLAFGVAGFGLLVIVLFAKSKFVSLVKKETQIPVIK